MEAEPLAKEIYKILICWYWSGGRGLSSSELTVEGLMLGFSCEFWTSFSLPPFSGRYEVCLSKTLELGEGCDKQLFSFCL